MRRVWLAVTLLLGCVRAPVAATPAEMGPAVASARDEVEPAPTPARAPAPAPAPALVLVDEDWVWDDGDLRGPLLRIVELRSANDDDPTAVRALLGMLEPLMACYEVELGRRPELQLTLTIRRAPPSAGDAVGLAVVEDVAEPTGMPECARRWLAQALPPQEQDPEGRYALRFFPHRDQAPPLRRPGLDDVVIEREGGACFTRQVYPCKPHKHCKAADWGRTRCRPPSDPTGAAEGTAAQ